MIPILTVTARLPSARTVWAACAAFALLLVPLGAQEQPPAQPDAEAAAQPAAEALAEQPAIPPPPEDDVVARELLANSPFMSKAFKERLAKSEGSRTRDLAFRGFAGDGSNWLICVYNNQSKRSEWVEIGAQVNGITIAEFDKEGMRIKVVKDATSTYLNLEQPK